MQKLIVIIEPIGKKLNRLDIFNNGQFIGEYERAQAADIERKKQEINCAFELLLEVYKEHGQFIVRWNGSENEKSIRVNDIKVASIPKECWRKPSWESNYLAESFENNIESDIDGILSTSVSETEKNNLIKTRIGQGTFRQKLIAYWQGCAITGYKDTSLLVASHIKPWRAADNAERLDHFNGLLMLPTLDKAFDVGLISFNDNGEILISPLLVEPAKLGISPKMNVQLEKEHKSYMQFHRQHVYRRT